MRVRLLAATLLLCALALQAATVQGYTVRDENRNILVASYGITYNPYAEMRVVWGSPGAPQDQVMSLPAAIEIHLDALDRNHIRLATALTAPSSSEPPQWPLEGAVWFHEEGWKESGARCPTVHSVTAPVDPVLDALVQALPETGLIAGDPRLGHFTTEISEHAEAQTGTRISTIQHYHDAANRTLGRPPNTSWDYVGWTLQAGTADDPDYIEFVCSEPPASRGVVRNNSFVIPRVDRVDD